MIFADGKTLLSCTILTATLWHGVLGSNHDTSDSDSWVNGARRLEAKQFMDMCDSVFMSPQHIQQQKTYSTTDFATDVKDMCRLILDPGQCTSSGFRSLDVRLREAFFSEAAKQHTGSRGFPMEVITAMGDAGYVFPDNSTIQQASMRSGLCAEVYKAIGGKQFFC